MRLLILNQFFYPDHSATSQLMTDLAESLVRRGVEVTAVAGRGRYNGGSRLGRSENYRGIRIKRAWSTSFGKRRLTGRLVDYLSFYLAAFWVLLTLPRRDVILALTTPPLISIVALVAGWLRRERVVTLVQDVYPDIAMELGVLRRRSLFGRLLNRIATCGLERSDRIVALSQCMRERLVAKLGAAADARIDVIHNWADGSEVSPIGQRDNPFARSLGLENRFVVEFSGNLGHVNEFRTVLEAATVLRDREDIVFLFIGEGAKSHEIKWYVRRQQLPNVQVLPYQPRKLLKYSLAAAHVSLVTLAEGLAGLSVPSKTYGILASGRPILFVGDLRSEIARIVQDNYCGEAIAAGESEKLAQTIREWSADIRKVSRMGLAARALFEHRFDRKLAVDAYLDTFRKCLAPEIRVNQSTAEAASEGFIDGP